jgi:hypothetical protein
MGFISSEGPQVQWAKISKGKVVLSSKTELEGYQSRQTKIGTVVFERFYNSFEGILVGINVKEGQYGSQFIFAFRDGEDVTNVCVDYDSRYSRALLNRLCNGGIDFKKVIRITPYDFVTKDDQRRIGVNVYQGAVKFDNAFTKDDVPEPTKTVVKKVITWDFTPQIEFFEAKIKELVLPKLSASFPFIREERQVEKTEFPVTREVQIEDDFFNFD